MVVDKNIRVGCGLTSEVENGANIYYFGCNFAYTNMVGSPIYQDKTKCSCKSGKNPTYTGLCSTAEAYTGLGW